MGLIQVSLVIGRSGIIDQKPLINRVRNLNLSNSWNGLFRFYGILVTHGSKTILHYMAIDEAANRGIRDSSFTCILFLFHKKKTFEFILVYV